RRSAFRSGDRRRIECLVRVGRPGRYVNFALENAPALRQCSTWDHIPDRPAIVAVREEDGEDVRLVVGDRDTPSRLGGIPPDVRIVFGGRVRDDAAPRAGCQRDGMQKPLHSHTVISLGPPSPELLFGTLADL